MKECTEEKRDMKDLCYKCNKKGHLAVNCENTLYCYECEQEGHRAATMECGKYKKEVIKLRNQTPQERARPNKKESNAENQNGMNTLHNVQ